MLEPQSFDALIQGLPGVFYLFDQHGKFLKWNDNFERVTGYSAQEIAAMHPLDFFAGADRELVEQRIKEVLAKGQANVEAAFTSKDKRRIPHLLTGRRIMLSGTPCVGGMGIDVSDRTLAQSALQASEQRCAQLLQGAPDPIVILSQEGRVMSVNVATERLFGYNANELVGKTFVETNTLDPDSVAMAGEEFARVLGGEERAPVIIWCVNKGGTRFAMQSNGRLIRFSDGTKEVQVILRDMTEHVKMEEALRQSKEYLENIINAISDPVFVKDRAHQFVLVNDALCRMAGRRHQEFIGKTDYDFFPKEQVDVFWRQDELVFETGRESVNEELITDAQGSARTIVTKKRLYTDKACNKFIVGVIRDITDRLQVETRFKEAEGRFKTVFNHTIDGILLVDPMTKRFHLCNKALAHMLGYGEDEVTRLSMEDIHPQETLPYVMGQFEKQARGEMLTAEAIPVRRKDGQVFYADISASPVTLEGHRYLVGIFRDMTERRQLEQSLRHSEERFRELFNNAHACVAVYEAKDGGNDFIFKDFNRAAEQTDHIRKEEVIGKSVLEIFPGVEEFGLLKVLQDVWTTGVPQQHPVRLYQDDRISGWKENYVYKLKSGEIVAAYTDITERKQAEEALKVEKERLESLNVTMMGREERVLDLKNEVNALMTQLGRPPKYGL